ncbi:Transcription factor IWS1 [Fusarium oxysporum f. sp. raphani]|uniref:Transcription factor IWS1 n=1 Tax=Fusarium oxysporum f. sp. raphani TaxID=96318 RepID=A0A8J5UDG0_FUSOX|nr:Transcription factor IWS1 [Fusarium oxysporum f. sp. raphani]
MSERDSPIGEHANEPVNDGQEQEYEDAVAAADSDRDSDALSEVDEDQFEDYDPETANIEDRPVDIDEDVARTLKATKRKRADGEARRSHAKAAEIRSAEIEMKIRAAGDGERRQRSKPASPEPEKEENLTPAERKQRELDRMIDAAIKKPSGLKRRKKDEIDLEDEIDDLLADLKVQMEQACQADNQAREAGQPALHKLKLLPEVTAILNRNNVQHAVLDPDTNFLQHVKFFLEPLNDGSLPAYNIQRDIFNALAKMNIEKEALLSSGIGRVVVFYTRSKKPEPSIKRIATRLLGEWSRPILKRTDDYKKRQIETRDYDYESAKMAQRQKTSSQFSLSQRPAVNAKDAERERLLAPSRGNNSARMVNLPSSYTVAPQSTFMGSQNSSHRPLGAGGMEAFRKMAQKSKKRAN